MKQLLLAVDLFLAGGLVALLLVRNMLTTTMYALVTPAAQAERLNVLDKLLSYYAVYTIALIVAAVLTALVWGLRARPAPPRA